MNSMLLQVLCPHWEAHQREGQSTEFRLKAVKKDLDEFTLVSGVETCLVDEQHGNTHTDNQRYLKDNLTDCLLHFFDCAMLSVMEIPTGNQTRDSIDAILELTAAVAADDVDNCKKLVSHVTSLSESPFSDAVRKVACRMIGFLVRFIMASPRKDFTPYNDVLDMASQALLPRFTDKSQLVRHAAITATKHFFVNESTDPDILQALLWGLQHDPSFSNRIAAIHSIPVTLETVDYLVARVRDVKPKVRVAALEVLQQSDITLLEAAHCATLVHTGYTDRCDATRDAMMRLICCGWLKQLKYSLVALFRHLDLVNYEDTCQKVIEVLCRISSDSQEDYIKLGITQEEVTAIRNGLERSKIAISSSDGNEALSPEALFLSVALCKVSGQTGHDSIISQIVPDMSVFCQLLEKEISKLISAIQEEDSDLQEEFTFVCTQLLQLVMISDLEEGSRRLMKSVARRLLLSILTPDDLIESAVYAYECLCRTETEFVEDVDDVCRELSSAIHDDSELNINHSLRVVSIITLLLEKISISQTSSSLLTGLSKYIVPGINHDNLLIREASVSCLGKLGFFSCSTIVVEEYVPLLFPIGSAQDESIDIRAQAIMGLCDWSLLFDTGCFVTLVSSILEQSPTTNGGLACIVAEAAAKILVAGKIRDSSWLAHLLIRFFEVSRADDDGDESDDQLLSEDVKKIGNGVRLQQMLSVFFPAFCAQSVLAREALIGAITTALLFVFRNTNQKKARKRKGGRAFPTSKMIDFVASNVETAEDEAQKSENTSPESSRSPIGLLIAVQISAFLSKACDDINKTNLRLLCKLLGSLNIDYEKAKEGPRLVSLLSQQIDELAIIITDETALESLVPLNEFISEVTEGDETGSVDGQHSLADTMEKIDLSDSELDRGKENLSVASSPNEVSVKPTNMSSARARRFENRQRKNET